MTAKSNSIALILIFAIASTLVFYAFPETERNGAWAHNVLNNWEQYGFFQLGGQLVSNPGGHGALENPEIYGGHRPHVARAAYVFGLITGSPGENGWLFHATLSVIVGLSIWVGLGKTNSSALLAFATIISPGFIRTPLGIDTLAIPVLLGIPMLFLAASTIGNPQNSWRRVSLFAFLLIIYTFVNWTTALALGIIFSYLLANKNRDLKKLFLFLIVSGISASLVLFISLINKKSGDSDFSESVSLFFNSYLFGSGGYGGIPMDWATSIRRIFFANALGLLPMICAMGIFFCLERQNLRIHSAAFLPLVAGLAGIAILRNYFAAHPWMAAPVLILGLVGTAKLLIEDWRSTISNNSKIVKKILFLTAFLCLAYTLLIAEVFKINSAGMDSIFQLIRSHTDRTDIILIDPQSFSGKPIGKWLESACDRKTLEENDKNLEIVNRALNRFILTSNSRNQPFIQIAQTDARGQSTNILSNLLDWYRSNIARRAQNDSPVEVETYYLYSLPNGS
jgi:hypothetical protein